MTTLLTRGRAALLLAVFAATAAPGCGLMDGCRDGSCWSTKSEALPAGEASVPAPPNGETSLTGTPAAQSNMPPMR